MTRCTSETYRVLRRALMKYPLTRAESRVFEAWQEGRPEAFIFERTSGGGDIGIVSAYVRTCKNMDDLREAFNAVFGNADEPPVGDRRIVSSLSEEDMETSIETSTGEAIPAHYELRELDDIIPSHSPGNQFRKRIDYPEDVQERPYHSDGGEQEKVRRNAANLNGRFLITDTPDAITGPPVISSSGVVLGGNSRTMSMQLAQEAYPEKLEDYKSLLAKRARSYGFTKSQVESMKSPVLVRVIDQKLDRDDMAIMSRAFNETTTQALQADAEAVSKSKRLSSKSLATVADAIGDFDSLRKYLDSSDSEEFVESLKRDGAIEQTQASRITGPDGKLNPEGKNLVERILRGAIVQGYDVIRKSGPEQIKKVDMSLPSLVQLKTKPGWDMSGTVEAALRQITAFRATWSDKAARDFGPWQNNIGTWLATGNLMADPEKENKAVQVLAMSLAKATGQEVSDRFALMAADSKRVMKGGLSLFAGAGPDPQASFKKAFMSDIAFIGGVTLLPFKPNEKPLDEAVQWAAEQDCKTVKDALARLEKIKNNKDSTPDMIAEAQRRGNQLYGHEGKINVYPSKLPASFALKPGEKMNFIPAKKNDEAGENENA